MVDYLKKSCGNDEEGEIKKLLMEYYLAYLSACITLFTKPAEAYGVCSWRI